ncbi:hypothetical protein D9V41_11220 [Aeromicrobium phragmitis]|uniref:Uncharacterized protein n=1 Tax=Aeromicrobium phragmitis TaxID=2478914 RepID=A0A3L8PJ02_9ACTN|nr:hypothetical protein [Aeromicrobium phragmitis]RLV55327.1 hypothetical protein D9V41_11220 [Aeromicrobium phragmitis]
MEPSYRVPSLARRLVTAATMSLLLTLTTVVGLYAANATLTVAAVALLTVTLGWFARLSSGEQQSGLGAVNGTWALALAVVGRHRFGELLPLLATQILTALVAGLGLRAVGDRLGEPQLFADPQWVSVTLVSLLAAVVGTWAVLGVDGDGPDALLAAPVVLAGAGPTVVLVGAANPAVFVGVAAAGLVPWGPAAAGAGLALVGAMAGAYAVALITPAATT